MGNNVTPIAIPIPSHRAKNTDNGIIIKAYKAINPTVSTILIKKQQRFPIKIEGSQS